MSSLLNEFRICDTIPETVKQVITKFYIFGENVVFITIDDRVYGLGSNQFGCLGLGHVEGMTEPTLMSELCDKNICRFYNGFDFVLALNNDNQVYGWGRNQHGQLSGDYMSEESVYSKPECIEYFNDKTIIQLSCGRYHSLALSCNGEVYGWGRNHLGQCGDGRDGYNDVVCRPTQLKSIKSRIKYILCSHNSSFALTIEGLVYSWGENSANILGQTINSDFYTPRVIQLLNIERICVTKTNSYFLNSEGVLYFSGKIAAKRQKTPIKVCETVFNDLSAIEGYNHKSCATVLCNNILYELNENSLKRVDDFNNFDEYYAKKYQFSINTIDLNVQEFRNYINYRINTKLFNESELFERLLYLMNDNIKSFYIFDDQMGGNILLITSDDKVYGFGSNQFGCIGLGHRLAVYKPQIINELCHKNITEFYNGFSHLLCISSCNDVFACGGNDSGQLGRGYVSEYNKQCSIWEKIVHANNWNITHISCGSNHSLALSCDGEVYGWGDNKFGQVGCGTNKNEKISKPVELKLESNIKYISCFKNSSFALTDNGMVYSWGENQNNILGQEMYSNKSLFEPKLIDLNTDIIQVCCSLTNSYFLTTDRFIYICCAKKTQNQIKPEFLTKDIKFKELHQTINYCQIEGNNVLSDCEISRVTALSEDSIVYELKGCEPKKTDYNTINEFYLNELQLTHKTFLKLQLIEEIAFDNVISGKLETISEKFETIEIIGSGSFATVFKVFDKMDKKFYAIKRIAIKDKSNTFITSINNEIKIMAQLRNDFIVQYFDSWTEENLFTFIQMEFCSDNLENVLIQKRKAFDRNENEKLSAIEYIISYELFAELIEGVNYLYELNPPVIHRDLKPDNILICDNNSGNYIRICDFGSATFETRENKTHCQGVGTAAYLAPEVLISIGSQYNSKADIYSLTSIALLLFDIDIDSLEEYEQDDNSIVDMYISNIYNNINEINNRSRPSCSELLLLSKDWRLHHDVIIENYLKNIPANLKLQENEFLLNFFTSKLKNMSINIENKFSNEMLLQIK